VTVILLTLIAVVVAFNIFRQIRFSRLSSTVSPISANAMYSMAIRADGSLWTWGFNSNGQLGDGTKTDRLSPVRIMEDVVAVSSFGSFAIKTDGTLWGWGLADSGQLGIGGTIGGHHAGGFAVWPPFFPLGQSRVDGPILQPVQVMRNIVDVSSKRAYSMALRGDGTLFAWGDRQHHGGQPWLPQAGTHRITTRPRQMAQNIAYISAGGTHAMAIDKDGNLLGWGRNDFGQVSEAVLPSPRHFHRGIKIMENVTSVSAGWSHTAAIMEDGSLWSWGQNGSGQLGNGEQSELDTPNPTPVRIMDGVIAVSAGDAHTMAITEDGRLWAWGDNSFGQLGDGTTENRLAPVFITNDIIYVSAGSSHTLVVSSDGGLWAWGSNSHGQLGDGTTKDRHSPVRVMDELLITRNLNAQAR